MKEFKPFSLRAVLTFAATAALALTAPFASAVTVTFNTPGTTNWTCPAGVFEIQVEVWGGGGAGGAGTKVLNTGTNTIQNGGGGGGGGYARVTTVPVTPGLSYAITIPAAAVSGTNGLLAGNIVNGEAVSFTGDASVTVTANGGAGGRNAYVSGANAPSGATGGAGGAGTTGDVITSGGNGANGTTGGGNVSGGGGGSGGDTTNGSNGAGATGGAGGVAGGGVGGDGSAAGTVFASRTDGSPGATPGGGGGGAHNLGQNTYLGGTGGSGQIVISYPGATIVKDDNVLDLNDGASWVGGTAPLSDNPAKWDATVTGANSTLLGADAIWGGIEIVDPAGLVTIGGSNILTLGDAAVDLDLSAATQNLTLDCDLALGAAHVWDVASGRTLTLNGEVSGTSSINIEGEGVTVLSGDSVYTGSTTLNGGTLDITGSLTGDTASSRINIFPASGNAVVNYSGGTSTLQSVRGANVVGTSSVFNMSGGLVTVSPGNTTGTQSVSGTGNNSGVGAYGCYNITNGTFKNTNRFTMTGQAPADPVVGPDSSLQTAVVYVGGTGVIDQTNGEWWLNYSLGQITVADSGIIDRTGSTSPFGLIMNHAANNTGGGYGVLNIAGADAQVILGAQPIRFGNSTNAAQGSGQSGFVNVAAGTLSVGTNVNKSLPSSPVAPNNAYFNFAGGTVKASGNVSGWIPLSDSSINFNSNLYGPIDNPGTTEDFMGGLTVDSDGFEIAIANPLQPAGGFGVTQADLTVIGGSDYVGPPAVIFSDANVLAGGSPAAGYAVISGGAVTAIVITSPGTYDTATTPDVILVGGGGTGASVTSGELTTPNTSGDLTKVGEGALVLSGANTYTGTSFANVGSLKFVTGASGASNVVVADGAAAGARVAVTDEKWTSTGNLTLDNGGAVVVDYGSTALSQSFAPIEVADFSFGTTPGVILEADSVSSFLVGQTYPLVTWTGTGPTDVSAFSVFSHRGSLAGTFSIVGGNTLAVTITTNTTAAPITWSAGDGTWDELANNWVDSGLAATAYVDVLDSVIFGDATGASGNPAITLDSVFTPLSVTMNSTSHDYSISGTGGIAGGGALTLDAANTRSLTMATANDTYTGDVTVNGGTLVGAGAFSGSGGVRVFGTGSSARTFTVNSGGALQFDSGNIFSGNFATTNVPALVIDGGTVTNGGIATNNALGLVSLNNGTLTATTGSTSGYGAFNLNSTVTSTGTSLISTSDATNGVMMLTSNGANNVATYTTFDVQSGMLTISAPLGEVFGESKVSGLTKIGAGTLILSSDANDYSADTIVSQGTLQLGAANVISDGSVYGNLVVDGTFDLNGFSEGINGLSGSGIVDTLSGGTPLLTVGNNNQTSTFNGVLQNTAGSLSLAKTGSGTLTLGGANTFTGSTTLSGGTLSLSNVDALSTTTSLTLADGTLIESTLNGAIINAPITIGGTGTTASISAPINAPGGGVASTITLNGAITGDGNVTFTSSVNQNAASTVLLNAQSTYLGDTLMDRSPSFAASQIYVKLGIANALPTTTVLTIDGQVGAGTGRVAQLDLNGFSQELAGLTNVARNLRLQRIVNISSAPAATLTVNNATDYEYSGLVGQSNAASISNLGVIKNGAGKLTLSGTFFNGTTTFNNGYTGDTTVSEGILSLAYTNGNNDASTVTIAASGATLDLTYGGTDTVDQLFIGATQMAAGEYGALGSVLPVIGIAEITGSGTLTVTTGPAGYATWATTNAGGQGPDLDFDNDGVQNGIEYFMNAAAGFTASPQLDGSNTITWPNGGNIDASEYGPTGQFVIQTSSDLSNWADVLVGDLTTNTDGPGGELTYTLTGGAPRFLRLMVTPN